MVKNPVDLSNKVRKDTKDWTFNMRDLRVTSLPHHEPCSSSYPWMIVTSRVVSNSAHTVTYVVQHVLPRHLHHMRKHGRGVILRHLVPAEGPVGLLVYTSVDMLMSI